MITFDGQPTEPLAPIETASPPRRDTVESGTDLDKKQTFSASKQIRKDIVLCTLYILQKKYGRTEENLVAQ